jgi:hypothetical protein
MGGASHPDPAGRRYAAPYPNLPQAAADLCDLGRSGVLDLLRQLGVPTWGA